VAVKAPPASEDAGWHKVGIELVIFYMAVIAVGLAIVCYVRAPIGCDVQAACDVVAEPALGIEIGIISCSSIW